MSALSLWRLFHRRGRGDLRDTSVLAIVAFAAAAAIFLTVLGGVHGFLWRASVDHGLRCLFDQASCVVRRAPAGSGDSGAAMYNELYLMLAIFACLLLAVPFVALAGSAARLAASRRDARLAGLRLAGATNGQVIRLTALDAAGQAGIGVLAGMVGYVAMMPAVGLLSFQGRHFGVSELWVGVPTLLAVAVGMVLLALVSSLVTLRRVSVTPLGVMQRAARPLPGAWRVVAFVAALAGAVGLLSSRAPQAAAAGVIVVFAVVIGCFALVNLVGVWAVAARARRMARHPRRAASLIAARRILDDPKRAWRNVSGIALAVFIAGVTSVTGYVGSMVRDADASSAMIMGDIATGGMLTLGFASVLAAVSCSVMQAGNVADQEREYRMLMLEGTDAATLDRARFIEVLTPLNTVVVIAAGCSMLLMLPLLGTAMVSAAALASFFGGIALCYALVMIGVLCANRAAHRITDPGEHAVPRVDD
ncbi:MAG: ABC transporter permease [Bifidobacterium mongoliense]|nr:ABC transporter permease [Bifidobacterium mongoliense]